MYHASEAVRHVWPAVSAPNVLLSGRRSRSAEEAASYAPTLICIFGVHASTLASRCAFSSQSCIPMSRYIVVAVVRCSCAWWGLPVRR